MTPQMTVSYTINKSPSFIFNCLANAKNFVLLHPVITRMDALGETNFLVYETLKLGFISHSFTYPATIESLKDVSKVIMTATVLKRITIKMSFRIMQAGGGSLVEEELNFGAPWPMRFLLKEILKKQHARLFENIRNGIDKNLTND
jgi:hypothetical protein